MRLAIVVTGARQAAEAFRRAGERGRAHIGRGLRRAAGVIRGQAVRIIYAGHPEHLEGRTGRLRQSIQSATNEVALTAQVGTNVIYAPVHEFGATIRPKGHPFLRFRGKSGEWVFMREVTIPPRPYLGPAAEAKGQEAADAIVNALYEVFGP